MDRTIFITGPDPSLELLYSDVWLPGLYSRRILCFELPQGSTHEKVIDAMERAMKALVQGTPELGSSSVVVPNAALHDPSQPWRALAPGDGIQLSIKDMTKTFQSYKELEAAGFPLAAFKDADFMPIAGAIMPEPQPQSKFQLSLIEGGVLLSVCLYHHLHDGNGINTVTRALGDECRRAADTKGQLPPRKLNHDRSIMASLNGGLTDLKEHPAYSIKHGVFIPGIHHDHAPPEANGEPAPPPPEFVPAYFNITNDNAQALKDYGGRDMRISTHDAITAAIWRTLTVARFKTGQLKEDTVSTFTVPHNARQHVGLDKDWVGNCVYFISCDAKVSDIIQEDSLPMLAAKIRTELNRTNRERVEGLMTLRKRDPYSLAWWPIGMADKPHIVALTSMYHSEIVGYDFGPALGKVKHFTSTKIGAFGPDFQRAHFVGPKIDGGQACNVYVGLVKDEVDPFSREPLWSRYFSLLEVRGNAVSDV
ncbi:transferase family [Lecanosticta acicola]|uniref:Transferase family n=1 Tax=Lecanosticta acicola TaxID=111012 RepID=A0AAI8Z1E9_9PEZI|nr:transferase family [Lecanosticta acicola]